MADASTVARPYAQALFDLANAERKLPAWSAALGAAAAVVGDENAKRALGNPALDDRRRAEFVASVVSAMPVMIRNGPYQCKRHGATVARSDTARRADLRANL